MDEQSIKNRIKEYLYNSTMIGLMMPRDRYQLLDEVEKYNISEEQLNQWIIEVQQECGFATGPSQKKKKLFGTQGSPVKKVVSPSTTKPKKVSTKTVLTALLVLLLIGLATAFFVIGPNNFLPGEQEASRKPDTYYEETEKQSAIKDAVAQDAVGKEQQQAVASTADRASKSSSPKVTNASTRPQVKVASTVEDHLVQISNESLPLKEREQIAQEAMKYFSGENAQVLIFTNGQRTGRESIRDYLDILLFQKYKVTINDKHTNNEGKITQLSVVEQ